MTILGNEMHHRMPTCSVTFCHVSQRLPEGVEVCKEAANPDKLWPCPLWRVSNTVGIALGRGAFSQLGRAAFSLQQLCWVDLHTHHPWTSCSLVSHSPQVLLCAVRLPCTMGMQRMGRDLLHSCKQLQCLSRQLSMRSTGTQTSIGCMVVGWVTDPEKTLRDSGRNSHLTPSPVHPPQEALD